MLQKTALGVLGVQVDGVHTMCVRFGGGIVFMMLNIISFQVFFFITRGAALRRKLSSSCAGPPFNTFGRKIAKRSSNSLNLALLLDFEAIPMVGRVG